MFEVRERGGRDRESEERGHQEVVGGSERGVEESGVDERAGQAENIRARSGVRGGGGHWIEAEKDRRERPRERWKDWGRKGSVVFRVYK